MNPLMIFIPAIIMVCITAIAWLVMFSVRIPAMQKAKIDLSVVRSRELSTLLPERAKVTSEHFLNQFEMPTLFYVVIIFIFISKLTTDLLISLAFTFVFFRAIHTLITVTYNNVMHRFTAYLLSSIVLWSMWALFALAIFQQL